MPYIQKSFTYDGKRYFVKGKTEKEVSRKLDEKKRVVSAGIKSIKYKDWFKEFIDIYKANVTDKTREVYLNNGKIWFKPIEDKYVSEITQRDCQDIANSLSGYNKVFSHNVLSLLKCSLDKAVLEKYCISSPMVDIPQVKGKEGHRRALTKQEREVLEPLFLKDGLEYLFCSIVYYCGLRPSEVSRIKGKHIRGNNLVVDGTKTPSSKRTVPVPDVLCLPFVDDNEYLFPHQKGHIPAYVYEYYWDKISKEADIDATLYCLRHDYCTRLEEAGVPINVARRLMGHSSIEMTSKIYTHENDKSFEDARERINRYVDK